MLSQIAALVDHRTPQEQFGSSMGDASSDEEASQLLVAFLESARNRRVPSIAEDDGGWGDASGSDADGDAS